MLGTVVSIDPSAALAMDGVVDFIDVSAMAPDGSELQCICQLLSISSIENAEKRKNGELPLKKMILC